MIIDRKRVQDAFFQKFIAIRKIDPKTRRGRGQLQAAVAVMRCAVGTGTKKKRQRLSDGEAATVLAEHIWCMDDSFMDDFETALAFAAREARGEPEQ